MTRRREETAAVVSETVDVILDFRCRLKVQIIHKGDKGGEMKIAYKSLEQLDELTRRLSKSG